MSRKIIKNVQVLKNIVKIIKKANSIAIINHVSPDIDAYGSMIGLYLGLEKTGKKMSMFSHEVLSNEKQVLFGKYPISIGNLESKNFDLLISVDVATKDRLGIYKDDFVTHSNTIKIDHHRVGNEFAQVSFVDYERSSSSEIIFDLLDFMGVNINAELATCLYAGLSADTYSFINLNTNKWSFETGKQLLDCGADIASVNDALHRTISLSQLAMKRYLYDNMEIIDNEIAVICISLKDLERLKATKQDCDSHSSELISIEGVNISCAIIEKEPNIYGCSMRSMQGYSVSVIAQRLGGGGHVGAAGCTLTCKSIKEAKEIALDAMKKYLKSRVATNEG